MVYYGLILKKKEKDNPTPFCRASYIISNVGDLVYCYGRTIRFPHLKNAFMAEMKLALGDVIIQCEMAGWDIGDWTGKTVEKVIEEKEECDYNDNGIEDLIGRLEETIADIIGELQEINKIRYNEQAWYNNIAGCTLCETSRVCKTICKELGWNPNDVRHLGFLHVCERLEQFEREGWK